MKRFQTFDIFVLASGLLYLGCSSAPSAPHSPSTSASTSSGDACVLELERLANLHQRREAANGSRKLKSEGLTREQVGMVFNSHTSELRACADALIDRSKRAEGDIKTMFLVNSLGKVEKVCIAEATLQDVEMNACLEKSLRAFQFPAPLGEVAVKVTYPLHFKKD